VRPTHGRSVPKAAGGREKPGHEAARGGQNGGKSGGIQCRVSWRACFTASFPENGGWSRFPN